MSRSIEIELKFEILDGAEVSQFVKDLKVLEHKRIIDVYLDTKDSDLFKRGIFVRIRNGKKFDIKFNPEHIAKDPSEHLVHDHCDELSIPLPFTPASMSSTNETLTLLELAEMKTPALEDLIKRNDWIESITVDKERTSYEDGEFHIDLDTVEGLGEYLEIEKMTDEHTDRRQVLRKMRDRLKGLGLKHVDVGYNELYWRKHNFELYLQGKYLLDEDKEKYRGQGART